MHVGWKNEIKKYKLRASCGACNTAEKDLWVIEDHKLKGSQKCDITAKKGNSILRGVNSNAVENNFSTLFDADGAHLGSCVWFYTSHFRKDMDKLDGVWKRATEILTSLENITCEKKVVELGLTEKEMTEEGLDNSLQVQKLFL